MTGPEHYREAEADIEAMAGKSPAGVNALLARAQVHATLALADSADQRCRSTHIHQVTYMTRIVGVQCKYTVGHDGLHCGYTGYNDGDVTWADES